MFENNPVIAVAVSGGPDSMALIYLMKEWIKSKKGKIVALESANKKYETKIFGPDRVKVQGVLVSLYRNFQ